MRMYKLAFLLVMIFTLPTAFAAKGGPWHLDGEISFGSDDNVGKSAWETDILKDSFMSVSFNANYVKKLSFFSALIFTGSFQHEKFKEFDTLSSNTIGGTAALRFQTRSGFTAPRYLIFVSMKNADFVSEIRDSTFFNFGAQMSKRVTDRITSNFGLNLQERESESRVFDTSHLRFFANADYKASKRISLYSTYAYMDGDIVSTAQPRLVIGNEAEALEIDSAFGGLGGDLIDPDDIALDLSNLDVAYRLDAKTTMFTLGINFILNSKNSIDLSAEFLDSESDGGIEYEREFLRASYLVRF